MCCDKKMCHNLLMELAKLNVIYTLERGFLRSRARKTSSKIMKQLSQNSNKINSIQTCDMCSFAVPGCDVNHTFFGELCANKTSIQFSERFSQPSNQVFQSSTIIELLSSEQLSQFSCSHSLASNVQDSSNIFDSNRIDEISLYQKVYSLHLNRRACMVYHVE